MRAFTSSGIITGRCMNPKASNRDTSIIQALEGPTFKSVILVVRDDWCGVYLVNF
jgi:hypothetical protein